MLRSKEMLLLFEGCRTLKPVKNRLTKNRSKMTPTPQKTINLHPIIAAIMREIPDRRHREHHSTTAHGPQPLPAAGARTPATAPGPQRAGPTNDWVLTVSVQRIPGDRGDRGIELRHPRTRTIRCQDIGRQKSSEQEEQKGVF